MTTLQESVIDSPNWLSQVASKYLTIYVGELEAAHDWDYHIGILSSRLAKKYSNQEEMVKTLRNTIACAILLPVYDRKSLTDPPENLLYWCSGYRQFVEKDWYDLLYNVVKKDQEIIKLAGEFLFYAAFFQLLDGTATPIQGILRGYKDVKAAFYASLFAYWGICLPLGYILDVYLGHGPYSYWQSLITGIFFSAAFLLIRLRSMQRKCRE